MKPLPNLPALSIRQPWAWAIVNGYKDVENRSWPTKFRGRFLVHAGKRVEREDWKYIAFLIKERFGREIPGIEQMSRGGFVGIANLVDCVSSSPSPWFGGPYGFVLRDAVEIEFVPGKGALGFFNPSTEKVNHG